MMYQRRVRTILAMAATLAFAQPTLAPAQTAATAPKTEAGATTRDGQHDFDWMHGNWKATLKRLDKPLTGSTKWNEYAGTQHTIRLYDGRANVDEFVTEDPVTKSKVEGLTIRTYNPETHQWSIYWANMKSGAVAMPPTVGHFENGRGEFYDREDFNGRPIVVRYVWSDVTPTSAHFEQSFSVDDGKTWEVNWISDITRAKE
jgi:hypothetical protein